MRMLKLAVVVMGVLIVGGVVTLVALLTQRVVGTPVVAAPAMLDEPAGTRIAGASVVSDRVALTLQGGGPDRVVIVELRTGHVVGRVGLSR